MPGQNMPGAIVQGLRVLFAQDLATSGMRTETVDAGSMAEV